MSEQTAEQKRRAAVDTLFSSERYKKNEVKGKEFFFADGSDAMANNDFVIMITHVPSEEVIIFKAFITTFNDTFSQDWGSEQVYGRADPLYNFKQTTRKISIGFQMPAASEGEAYENLTKAQRFSQFLYPNYTTLNGGARTVAQGPLLRLKVMNLLQATTSTTRKTQATEKSLYENYGAGGLGMLGFCSDVTFNFNLEGEHGVFQKSNGTILPKLIEVSIGSFSPIHEHHLGWDGNKKFSSGQGELFPYGAQHTKEEKGKEEGASYSELERQKDERARAEAAVANAEARYGGMFGNMRRKKDERRTGEDAKRPYTGAKAAYAQSALAGQQAIDQYDQLNEADALKDGVSAADFVEF
jgi:hypothetical protein